MRIIEIEHGLCRLYGFTQIRDNLRDQRYLRSINFLTKELIREKL